MDVTRTVTLEDALANLLEYLESAGKGETTVVTKGGEPIARIAPPANAQIGYPPEMIEIHLQAARDIRGRTRPGPESIRELIEHGRR